VPSATLVALHFGGDIGTPFMSGLVSGSIYGLVALGIVLIYKSNRIFNFAQAEFGSVAGIIALAFVFGLGPFPKVPYFFAAVFGVLAGTLTGLATERFVIRPLFDAPRATLLVATAGVALFCIGMELVLLGTGTLHVLPRPGGPPKFALFGSATNGRSFVYGWAEIDAVLAFVALAIAATVFFRTRYGVAILAVSQEPTAAGVVGIDVRRISALTWGIAGFLGGVAGVLYAPLTGATAPGFFTNPYGAGPLIYGFIAAVIGGTTSLPGAMLGGLLVGEINAYAGAYVPKVVPSLPGSADVTLALLLLVVLLVRPVGLLGQET
jgi:branched-chain amino acid transport system permease protein